MKYNLAAVKFGKETAQKNKNRHMTGVYHLVQQIFPDKITADFQQMPQHYQKNQNKFHIIISISARFSCSLHYLIHLSIIFCGIIARNSANSKEES